MHVDACAKAINANHKLNELLLIFFKSKRLLKSFQKLLTENNPYELTVALLCGTCSGISKGMVTTKTYCCPVGAGPLHYEQNRCRALSSYPGTAAQKDHTETLNFYFPCISHTKIGDFIFLRHSPLQLTQD